jgi:DNA-binding NarL/FixJ family response regulator
MTRRTDDATAEEIARLHAVGLSRRRIAALVDVPASTVQAVLTRTGTVAPAQRPRRDAEILPLLDEGLTYQAISDRLSVSLATVHGAAKRAGRDTGARSRWTPARDQTLRTRFAAGDTYDQIAVALGVSSTTIGTRVRALGLTRQAPTRIIHGRPVCWQTGCMHPVCVAARSEYKRDERERGIARGPVTHGLGGYHRGCHCDICQAAHDASMRERQDRTRQTAVSHGEPWRADEDDAVMDRSRRIEDIAADLGRTYAAVDNRRRLLTPTRHAQQSGEAS